VNEHEFEVAGRRAHGVVGRSARSSDLVAPAWRFAEDHRWPVLASWAGLWSAAHWSSHGYGWHYFARGAEILTSPRGLHVFAIDPALQSGPLSFAAVVPLVTALPPPVAESAAIIVMALLGLLAVRLLESTSRRATDGKVVEEPDRRSRALAIGLLVLPVWAELSVHWSHPDDVLAILALLGSLAALRGSRLWTATVLLGLAVDCKPWALLFLPLLLLGPRNKLLPSALIFGGVVAAVWAPFLLADHRTLAASAFRIPIDRASVLHLFGLRGGTPAWCRSAQLILGVAFVAVAARRNRWAAALVARGCCSTPPRRTTTTPAWWWRPRSTIWPQRQPRHG
jgi:hypothetical protein